MAIFFSYFLLINLATFALFGRDKYKAEKQQRRIKEKDLLTMTAIGGFLGAVGGMSYFKHKTIKGAFLRKFWLIVVAWMAVGFGVLAWR